MRFTCLKHSPGQNGFTLIEVLVSILLITILAGITIPIYQSYQVRNDLDIAATTVALSLRRAQALSRASEGDSSWGLYATTGKIVLFKGSGFVSRDIAYDESTELPKSFSVTGINEVVFSKLTGLPQSTGTTTIVSNINETRNININAKGRIQY